MTSLALDLFTTLAAPPTKIEQLLEVSRRLAPTISAGDAITRQHVTREMADVFGATDASSAWSMRDGYDALEAAQVNVIRDTLASTLAT